MWIPSGKCQENRKIYKDQLQKDYTIWDQMSIKEYLTVYGLPVNKGIKKPLRASRNKHGLADRSVSLLDSASTKPL